MEPKITLSRGVDVFTLLDLLRKVAAQKGLKVQNGASDARFKPIKVYVLDDRLLAVLAERGIKRQTRPDCQNEIFTLVDENPQKKEPGWAPSNYWNFKLDGHKFDLRVFLSVGFELNTKRRGIVVWPHAHGSFVSPVDQLPNFRMFKTLVESDKDAPALAKELATSDGSIVVTWTDLGLGGICRLADLFAEFVDGNETIEQVGRSQEVFDPVPYPRYWKSDDELFVAEPAQPKIIQVWQTQLREYRASLVV
jgi:hypothetical protein